MRQKNEQTTQKSLRTAQNELKKKKKKKKKKSEVWWPRRGGQGD